LSGPESDRVGRTALLLRRLSGANEAQFRGGDDDIFRQKSEILVPLQILIHLYSMLVGILGWEIGEPPNPAAGRSLEIDGEIDETSVTRY
jgi:hypothetical protein